MAGTRTGTDTATSVPVTAAAPSRRSGLLRAAAVYLGAGLVLFVIYVRLSMTYSPDSDSANILLAAGEMLHGNLILHGWWASDVSFYSTELPQYALLTGIFGLHAQTAHIAAGMTYTLTFLLAVALGRAGTSGRVALVRTLIVAGIMLAPSLGTGVFSLDLSVGHIGTSVPLLPTWLLLDWSARSGAFRWWVPVVTALLLAWVNVADPIVVIVGIGPLALAALLHFGQGVLGGSGAWLSRVRAQWYALSLALAAAGGYLLSKAASAVLHALGGYSVHSLPFSLSPLHDLPGNLHAIWKVLTVFGADYTGVSGVQQWLAYLHLVSVAVVVAGMLLTWVRFLKQDVVDQILFVAIVVNVALFLLTNASQLAPNEITVIVPFGAVLAARQLTAIPWVRSASLQAGVQVGVLAGVVAAAAVLAGYAAGLGYSLVQPTQPMTNTELATWLEAHHFTYGLSGYWTSSSVTVDSGGKVEVRALMQYTMKQDLWMSDSRWYDPARHYANFIVLDSEPGSYKHWEPVALIRKYFGTPARIYHHGPYTIEVWNHNLLSEVP
jgi:hypothetical protein